MVAPLVPPLAQCHDASLAGGKAAGLARVLKAGLKVPPGCCLTTCAYRTALEAVGFSPVNAGGGRFNSRVTTGGGSSKTAGR